MRSWIILLMLIWGFEKVEAASIPAYNTVETKGMQPASTQVIASGQPDMQKSLHRTPRFQKQNHRKQFKNILKSYAKEAGKGNVLSMISLLFAAIAIAGFFIPSAGVVLLFGLGALITGIIGVSKRGIARGSKTKSIIGIVIGGLLTGIGIMAVVISAALSGFQ